MVSEDTTERRFWLDPPDGDAAGNHGASVSRLSGKKKEASISN
jgi:hypothetical protein